MYVVIGGYYQKCNIYNEEVLARFENKEEAQRFARIQEEAWDRIEVIVDDSCK